MNAYSCVPSSLMRHRGGDAFIDQATLDEAVEAERLGDRMRPVIGDRIGEDEARARNGLEAAGAPAAIDIEPLHIGLADDGRAVARHVDDAPPHAQHPEARNDWKSLDQRRHRMFESREGATLRVVVV